MLLLASNYNFFMRRTSPIFFKGFTLIELLLYIGISSIMLLIISVFLSLLIESRIKNQTVAEVEQQGLQVMEIITQTARNADAINTPTQGTSAPSLSLAVIPPANNPTLFNLSGSVIYITENINTPVALTNTRVIVSGLLFQNLSLAGTPGTIRIQFTLTHINTSGRNEYSFAKTFIGSATLRQP